MPRTVLLIIAQEGFQDVELDGTRKGLDAAGFSVQLASKSRGLCVGKYGGREQAETALADVEVAAYDRIGFIGGPGAHTFQDDPEAHHIARQTLELGKVLGAICIAPLILAEAGVLAGKRATVWNGDDEQGTFLIERGAVYTGEPVTVDGLIVTADGPGSAEEFGRVFAAQEADKFSLPLHPSPLP